MNSLFSFDWDTESFSDQLASPELAATLARLEIGVRDSFITVAEESQNGSIRRSINVSLYPLAEWIVFNWWRLLYGARSDDSVTRRWSGGTNSPRNNLRSAGDGFIWPDLTISPEGGMVRLEWHGDHSALRGRGIRYITNGVEWVEVDWVQSSFSDLVEAVLTRLEEAHVGETSLHKEWHALKALDAEEAEFCQACGRLGLDPFSEGT